VLRCSFCGTTVGPFLEVQGVFTVLMCARCQAARGSSLERYVPMTGAEMPASDPDEPTEFLAHHDPGEPWLEFGCPLAGCDYRVVLPWWLEAHAAAKHPGWVATWEAERHQVVYRRVGGQESGG
jgi:hypothetical protein